MKNITEEKMERMLLSYNFTMTEDLVPKLNIDEFTKVFSEGLSEHKNINCRQLIHPHWMVEILFPVDKISPIQVGELCVRALGEKRKHQVSEENSLPETLFLAGRKTTPPLSNNPEGLQTGEWGVDVVESSCAADFLLEIGWPEKTANKSENQVFKIERIC